MIVCVTQRRGIRYFTRFAQIGERDRLLVELRFEDQEGKPNGDPLTIDLTPTLLAEYEKHPRIGNISSMPLEKATATQAPRPVVIKQSKTVRPVYLADSKAEKDEIVARVREAQHKVAEERKRKRAEAAAAQKEKKARTKPAANPAKPSAKASAPKAKPEAQTATARARKVDRAKQKAASGERKAHGGTPEPLALSSQLSALSASRRAGR